MAGSLLVGYVCCLVAGLGFGSNYLPVKQVQVGDGVFFSACMSIGILLVGVLVNFTVADEEYALWPPHRPPRFEMLAAVGGGAWMLGNLFCPIIVRWLGLGLGLAIWDCFNLLTGWATGNLGLFGVWREEVASPAMNYAGVALAMVSLVVLAFASDSEEPEAGHDGKSAPEAPRESEVAEEPDLEQGESSTESEEAGQQETDGYAAAETCSAGTLARDAIVKSESGIKRCTTSMSMASNMSVASTMVGTVASFQSEEAQEDVTAYASWQETLDATTLATSEPEKLSGIEEISLPATPKVPAARGCLAGGLAAGFRRLSESQRQQIYGFALAIAAGFLFGLTFDLPTDLMQLGKLGQQHSTDPMDYVFSHFCGIAITGAVALALYVAVRREESYTPRNVVLPAVASGAMWAVAQVAWFQANVELSMSVAFPMISTLPGIVGMFWGYFCFGEFRTTRSRRLALAGMALRIPAVALIALSASPLLS